MLSRFDWKAISVDSSYDFCYCGGCWPARCQITRSWKLVWLVIITQLLKNISLSNSLINSIGDFSLVCRNPWQLCSPSFHLTKQSKFLVIVLANSLQPFILGKPPTPIIHELGNRFSKMSPSSLSQTILIIVFMTSSPLPPVRPSSLKPTTKERSPSLVIQTMGVFTTTLFNRLEPYTMHPIVIKIKFNSYSNVHNVKYSYERYKT